MRIVLDTDVSSLLLKRTLPPALLADLAPHEPAITFVTVGELRKWAVVRELGTRRAAELEAWVAARLFKVAGHDPRHNAVQRRRQRGVIGRTLGCGRPTSR